MKYLSRKIIVIVGPTASGKSTYAVRIAKQFGGEVISADSRQVYRGLHIGTGKITKKERRGIRHHVLNVASPRGFFTVARYVRLARRALEDIFRRGKVPIICGGTGFYIHALIDGLTIPVVLPDKKLRARLERHSTKKLFTLLRERDLERARIIDPHNRRRLIRALEIIVATGKVPRLTTRPLPYPILMLGIRLPDAKLRRCIHARLIERLRHGMVSEVQHLHQRGILWKRLDAFGLEYRYISRYLRHVLVYEDMVQKLEQEIWHYAKRQMTWFKRDKRIVWLFHFSHALRRTRNFLTH